MGFNQSAHIMKSDCSLQSPASDGLVRELKLIMPKIASKLVEATHADACSMFVYDDQRETIAEFRHGRPDAGVPGQVIPGQEEERRLCDLVVPVIWNDNVHGSVYLWRFDNPTPFTDREVSAAREIARMAAMAVVYARQYERERTQREYVNVLLEVAGIAASDLDLEDRLSLLANSIRDACGADVCNLFVFDERSESVIASFNSGLNDLERRTLDGIRTPSVDDVPVEVRMLETLEPVIVTDFERELATGSVLVDYARDAGLSGILVAPIVHQGKMIGSIYSWNRNADQPFSAESVATVHAIADQAGGIVSYVRLQEITRQQALEREALLRIGQAVLSTESLYSVLDEIVATLLDAIPHDYAFVALRDVERDVVTVIRDWGDYPGTMSKGELPLDGSLTGLAICTGELVSVADMNDDPRAFHQDHGIPNVRSALIAPLVTDRGNIGALFVGRTVPSSFHASQERLVSLLAQQAAMAIDRVRSREILARRERQQTFLATVVDKLVAGHDPIQILPEIARMATGTLADGVLLALSSWKYGQIQWATVAHTHPDVEQRLKSTVDTLDLNPVRYRLEEILTSGRTVVYTPDSIDPIHQYLKKIVRELGVPEFALVPLFQPERATGIMFLVRSENSEFGRFEDDDLELSRVVASRIGNALGRSRMNRNREALLRVSEALHAQTKLGELLEQIVREFEAILPFDQLYIAELYREIGMTRPIAYRDMTGLATMSDGYPADVGICGEVLRTRMPVMDNQAATRETTYFVNEQERDYFSTYGESAMVAPLISNDEVIGVLFINRSGNHRFTTSDFETFLLFAGLAATAINRTALVQNNRELHRASVEVIAAVVDAKDPTTLEHSRSVAHYCRLAAELMSLTSEEVEQIELAGLMHDIGKLSIPDEILRKPSRLNDEEFELIKTHPDRGVQILQQHPALSGLVPLVRHHHERVDGRGYPSGLSGDEIPLGACIIGVADAFDTMTSERTYQQRRTVDDALAELERCAGTQFHPGVVERFVAAIREDRSIVKSVDDTERPATVTR